LLETLPFKLPNFNVGFFAAPDGCSKPVAPPVPFYYTHYDFNVSIALKTPAHPYFGQGSSWGWVINGVEGPNLVLELGRTYTFNISSTCAHRFLITDIAEPGQLLPGGGVPIFTGDADDNGLLYANVLRNRGCRYYNQEMAVIVDENLGNVIFYQCDFHVLMGAAITIVNPAAIQQNQSNNFGMFQLAVGLGVGIPLAAIAIVIAIVVILRVRRSAYFFKKEAL